MSRRDDWIDDDEYPDERDMRDLGDDAPPDDDPLTIGRVRGVNDSPWRSSRVIIIACALLLFAVLVVMLLGQLPR